VRSEWVRSEWVNEWVSEWVTKREREDETWWDNDDGTTMMMMMMTTTAMRCVCPVYEMHEMLRVSASRQSLTYLPPRRFFKPSSYCSLRTLLLVPYLRRQLKNKFNVLHDWYSLIQDSILIKETKQVLFIF
jgi:hypothetical protein